MKKNLFLNRDSLSLKERVADTIRESILQGSFLPGEKLIERDLCESLGVSRTLLREALQQLQAEELITNVSHKGRHVATITLEEARDVYQVRGLLEAEAGRQFVLLASNEELAELKKQVLEFAEATTRGDAEELLEAKNGFYSVLLTGSGNQVIRTLLTQLNNRIVLLRSLSMSQPGRIFDSARELDAIYQAASERDSSAVESLLRVHVERAAEAALSEFPSKNKAVKKEASSKS
jgi:DNA-binding GntR family transcriptional regulator